MYPKGQEHPHARDYHVQIPKDGTPFSFSALFAGVGDARHVYESIADVGLDLAGLQNDKSPKNLNIHFCCEGQLCSTYLSATHPYSQIDINSTALARDLVVMTALDKLSKLPGPSRAASNNAKVLDLLLMLHYVYWRTTMPPAAQSPRPDRQGSTSECVRRC